VRRAKYVRLRDDSLAGASCNFGDQLQEPNDSKRSANAWQWFFIALLCFLPLHVSAVVLDEWFALPPKPIGDGPDYEAIGYGLSQGYGWSTSFSDPQWRDAYEQAQASNPRLDYSVQLARRGPVVADTNRPPLFPLVIGAIYHLAPRGPIAFGIIRFFLACCLSVGCSIAVAWGVAIGKGMNRDGSTMFSTTVGLSLIAIVYSERNLRNYTTDFLTEPLALLLTHAFLLVAWLGVKKGSWRWAAATGALFACMTFCRGVFVLWWPLLVAWLWYMNTSVRKPENAQRLTSFRWIWVCFLVFVAFCSAWWIRNCYVLGSFHPLGTKGATTLMGGYCDEALQSGGEWQFAPERELRKRLEAKIDLDIASAADLRELELEMGKQASSQTKAWIASNVGQLPQLVLRRAVTEWNPYFGKALILKLMALLGMIWLWRHDRSALVWLLGPLAINTIVVALTYSVGGRFLVPTYGPLYILAAFGVAGLFRYVQSYSRQE
jgi:hypothetical protein